jgi:hypothetical protein
MPRLSSHYLTVLANVQTAPLQQDEQASLSYSAHAWSKLTDGPYLSEIRVPPASHASPSFSNAATHPLHFYFFWFDYHVPREVVPHVSGLHAYLCMYVGPFDAAFHPHLSAQGTRVVGEVVRHSILSRISEQKMSSLITTTSRNRRE